MGSLRFGCVTRNDVVDEYMGQLSTQRKVFSPTKISHGREKNNFFNSNFPTFNQKKNYSSIFITTERFPFFCEWNNVAAVLKKLFYFYCPTHRMKLLQ